MSSPILRAGRLAGSLLVTSRIAVRFFSGSRSRNSLRTASTPPTSLFAPRHFLSIADLTQSELAAIVGQAAKAKLAIGFGKTLPALQGSLAGKCVAMMFSKRSTRTRVSTEAAVVHMGGHPMFLGKDDIQLGVSFFSREVVSPQPDG